jgi:FtsH-binding integral membrane protein
MTYATSSLYKTLFGGSRTATTNKIIAPDMVILMGGANTFNSLFKDKKQFLIYVFANLIVQLGITYYVMMNYESNNRTISDLMLFLSQIFIIFILALVPMPAWLKFILFSIFSVTFGIMLSSLKKTVDPEIIKTALLGTLGIFGGMFITGLSLLLSGIELTNKFGFGLLCALSMLIVVSIVFMFMGAYSGAVKGLSVIGLFLFSLFVIYDTNTILQRNYYGDFITASLDYYLDIINIFLNLINFSANR